MIITRTPFRASFAGGGSDVKWFYKMHGYGQVLSAALRQYMYITIHPYFHSKRFRLKYSETEDVSDIVEIKHEILRSCLQRFNFSGGIEVASFADVPAGTGLGSSSSFTVGLLHALYSWVGRVVPKSQLAEEACEIEIDVLGKPIGKQDQYAAAYGGVCVHRFNRDESVTTTPLLLSRETIEQMEQRLSLYYVSGTRSADTILSKQNSLEDRENKASRLRELVEMVDPLRDALLGGDVNAIGTCLHKGWMSKKNVAQGISDKRIDEYYDYALKCGATGGKLLGAGGTGFLMLYGQDHESIRHSLGLRSLPFAIDHEGSKLLYSEPKR